MGIWPPQPSCTVRVGDISVHIYHSLNQILYVIPYSKSSSTSMKWKSVINQSTAFDRGPDHSWTLNDVTCTLVESWGILCASLTTSSIHSTDSNDAWNILDNILRNFKDKIWRDFKKDENLTLKYHSRTVCIVYILWLEWVPISTSPTRPQSPPRTKLQASVTKVSRTLSIFVFWNVFLNNWGKVCIRSQTMTPNSKLEWWVSRLECSPHRPWTSCAIRA